jgi:para-nitrobenzyl esterase
MKSKTIFINAILAAISTVASADPQPVNVSNFVRAETDMYMTKTVNDDGFGKLRHRREPTPIDKQDVVRMNRDTLYSNGVFDLDAAPITITLPDSGKRYMALQVISQDHYTTEVVYAPGTFTYTKEKVGTRYVFLIIRTLADPQNPADVKAANALQDAIKVEQASLGKFEVPSWDPVTQKTAREALLTLASLGGMTKMFGRKEDVDPVSFLLGSAGGWGGNPPQAAIYLPVFPKAGDGTTAHLLKVKDVPVDGFWSISVYNKEGFFAKNDLGAYSLNNLTAKPDSDGSYTIQFGGDPQGVSNYLPISPGWNYTVRLYRPRKEIIDGAWKFPEAQPLE